MRGSLLVMMGSLAAVGLALPVAAQTTQPSTLPGATVPGPSTTQPAALETAVPTTAPATGPASPDADDILAQLASADWRERRAGVDRLVRLGESGKPFIEELIRRAPSAEARKNAQAALAQIAENRVLGASYLTLHVKDAAPAQVFAEISRQSFAPLSTMPDNLWEQGGFPKVTLDVDHKPFWDVVMPLCRQLGVDFRPFQVGMRLMRSGGGAMQMQGVSYVDGPFLVVADQISYSRTRLLGAGRGQQQPPVQFGINFSVYPEPKITVLRGGGTVQIDEAIDDRGHSLVAGGPAQRGFWGGGIAGFGGWRLYAPLDYPREGPGTRIVRLKGHTAFVVQTKSERLEIPDVMRLRPTTRSINKMLVTFKDVKRVADYYELHLSVAQPNFASPEGQQLMEQVQTKLQLLDAAGNALDHRGLSSTGNNNSIELAVDFGRFGRPQASLPEPAKLVWDIPVESRQINIPIEFKDLPLFDDQ